MGQKAYQCEDCGNEVIVDDVDTIPECCGKAMKEIPLDECTKASNPESARSWEVEDACDDGVH
ncbi:hypothetical protein [Sediminispirochaeta bajacaliforniensis]|uniref:hypothetical protein n=1 Tax=Sediminispirochaeta bajacaliforniensis TaxID=148 RepID=UPI0003746DCE|nr:hypothetical protein [Sediminispirochaeta bajacaliforniensis]